MAITCSELFSGIDCTVLGRPDEEVWGLAYRSDQVRPHDAFFCIVGLKVDGHSFAQDAINRGAKVIVCERELYLADATDVTLVVVSDSRKAMARAAATFYGNPSAAFRLVGVTGTNGKTTTTYLIDAVARHLGLKSGLIGTVGNAIDGVMTKSSYTTPESVDLQRLFAEYAQAGCEVVSMELSSHGLSLDRPWASQFAVTVFTNLTQDHLDYHHTFEEYFEAKAKLFSADYPATRVININDPWGRTLFERCLAAGDEIITTSLNDEGRIHPVSIEYDAHETRARIAIDDVVYDAVYPLVGSFNVENVLSALGALVALGLPAAECVAALREAPQVPGRLERLPQSDDLGFNIYIDYAHTPDAITKALASLRLISDGPITIVFGCEGDRDRGKRPLMGEAALAADRIVVTSDEPHSEDPEAIIAAVIAAMEGEEDRYVVIPDRRSAITHAIEEAQPGDNIIITGHGHEDEIEIGDRVIPFNDKVVCGEIIADFQAKRG